MNAGSSIATTGATVAVNVNSASAGTGGAALRGIATGAGGTITVDTSQGNTTGGSITQAAGTLNSGLGGTVALTAGGVTTNIGTGGANIMTIADIVTASAGNGGIFITESNGASFTATAQGSGGIFLTSTTGTLNIGGATSSGTGQITLTASAGTITQSGGATLSTAGLLKTISVGGTTLTDANNAVGSFAGANGTSGNISLTDTGGLIIADIGILNPLGNVILSVPGTVTQTSTITASGLDLQGAGIYTLTNPSNTVTTIAANTGGAINYRDIDGLTVGSVGTTNGITTSNDNVTLQAGGALTINQALNAGGGDVSLTSSGAITQAAAGVITGNTLTLATGGSSATLNTATNAVTNLGTSTLGAGALALTNDVPTLTVTGLVGATGGIVLDTTGALVINSGLNAGAGNVTLTTGGAISQNASGIITADTLALTTSNDSATLNTATNVVTNLGATALGSGALALTNDVPTLTVTGAVAATGGVTINTSGALLVDNTINAGAGVLSLTATAGITQNAGDILTGGTTTLAAGAGVITLTEANDFTGTVNASNSGANPIQITDANNITIGTITSSDAVTIISNTGSILDDGVLGTRIAGTTVTLTASTGANSIGTLGSPIGTDATTIVATSGTGGTFINELNGLTLGAQTTTGDFNLTAGGTITVAGAQSFAGNYTLYASGTSSNLLINDSLTATGTGQTLALRADNSVVFGGGASDVITTNPLIVQVVSDFGDGNATGGIRMNTGTDISSAGGHITLGGGGGTAAAFGEALTGNHGVFLDGATLNSGTNGNIAIHGRTTVAGGGVNGVRIDGGSSIQTAGTGTVAISGQALAGTTGSLNIGVHFIDGSITTNAAAIGGTIDVSGTGGGTAGGVSNVGVALQSGATIDSQGTAVPGTITVTGTRGNGADNNESVFVDGQITSLVGNIQITGNAGGTVTGANNTGVLISSNGSVTSTGTATIGITGFGGAANGGGNAGVKLLGGTVENTTAGGGTITVTGTGGAGSGASDIGVLIQGAGSEIESADGAITVLGTGGTGTTAGLDSGVEISNSGEIRSTGPAATISVTGFGGASAQNNRGVRLDNAGLITSVTGAITVAGTGAGSGLSNFGVDLTGGSSIESTGAAPISVTGTGTAGNPDIMMVFGTNTVGGGSATGDILLRGLSQGILLGLGGDAAVVQTTGNVTLNSVAGVTQVTGAISGAGLRLLGGGTFSLNSTTNDVATIAGTLASGATVSYTDANAVQVGSVTSSPDGVAAPTTSDGLNVGTGTVSLTTIASGSDITQTALGVITAGTLNLATTDANATLDTVANALTNLGTTTLGTGALNLLDASGLTVTGVVGATSGVTIETSGPLAINNTVNAGGSTMTLTTTGGVGSTITQTAAITADTLTGSSTSSVNLSNPGNTINNLDVFTSVGGFALVDGSGGLNVIGAVSDTTGLVSLQTTGGDLEVVNGSGSVTGVGATLISTDQSVNIGDTVDAGTGTATLTAGNEITESGGVLIGQNAILSAVNGIGLTNNFQTQVSNLQATNTNNGIVIFNTGDITLANLGAGFAVSNTNGGLRVHSTGAITVGSTVTAGRAVRLFADTDLNINANITAHTAASASVTELIADADGDGTGSITQASGTTINTNSNDLVMGIECGPGGGCGSGSGGSGQDITLATINAGTAQVRIRAEDGGILDANGAGTLNVTADSLFLRTEQGVNLDTAVNTLQVVNAVSGGGGNVVVRNTNGGTLALDNFLGGPPASVLNGNGNISISNDASINIVDSVIASNQVTLNAGGTVTQGASGDILATSLELQGAGSYTLTNTTNSVTTIAGNTTGTVKYVNAGALDVGTVTTAGLTSAANVTLNAQAGDLTVSNVISSAGTVRLQSEAGNVTQSAVITAATLGVNAGLGIDLSGATNVVSSTVAMNAAGGDLLFTNASSYNIDTVAADGTIFTAVNGLSAAGNNITLTTNAGTVTQTATRTVTATGLELLGAGAYTLTDSGNDVNTIAANTGGAISYRDTDDLTVGTVITTGITTSNDNVTLQTGTTLTINEAVSIGSGTLTLNSGGAVTQGASGDITAASLELQGAGSVTLTNLTNDVDTIAGSTSGTVKYVDATALDVGTVTTAGLTSAANVTLNAQTGDLTVSDVITTAGTARLEAVTGNVTGTAVITAATLGVNAGAGIDLSGATNVVSTTVAMNAAGGDLLFTNANSYNIDTVAADGTIFTAVNGLSAAGNNITLDTAAGTVTQTATRTVTASGLELQGAGSYTLTDTANDVATIAGSNTGTVKYVDANALTVGTVNATMASQAPQATR